MLLAPAMTSTSSFTRDRSRCCVGEGSSRSSRSATRLTASHSTKRHNTGHRFKRGESTVDVVTSGLDVVDISSLTRPHCVVEASWSHDGRHRAWRPGVTPNDQRVAPDRRRTDQHGMRSIAFRGGHLKLLRTRTTPEVKNVISRTPRCCWGVIEDPYALRLGGWAARTAPACKMLIRALPDSAAMAHAADRAADPERLIRGSPEGVLLGASALRSDEDTVVARRRASRPHRGLGLRRWRSCGLCG